MADTPKIVIGMYSGRTIETYSRLNYGNMVERLVRIGQYAGSMQRQSYRIDSNRNFLIDTFLTKYPDATHLLIIDDDMQHPPELPEILASRDKPIITGLYFRRDYDGHYYPVAYRNAGKEADTRPGHGNTVNDHFVPLTPQVMEFLAKGKVPATNKPLVFYEDNNKTPLDATKALLPIDGGGFGCLMLRRDALEQMEPPYLIDEPGLNGDLVFYRNARAIGIEIYADLSVICSHSKDDEFIGIEAFSRHCWDIDKQMREEFTYSEEGIRV